MQTTQCFLSMKSKLNKSLSYFRVSCAYLDVNNTRSYEEFIGTSYRPNKGILLSEIIAIYTLSYSVRLLANFLAKHVGSRVNLLCSFQHTICIHVLICMIFFALQNVSFVRILADCFMVGFVLLLLLSLFVHEVHKPNR